MNLFSKVGSAKGMEKISKWSEHIIRHFWHCSSTASQLEPRDDEVALRRLKVNINVANIFQ